MSDAAEDKAAGGAAGGAARWRAIPKIELHLHLEGAAPPALTRAIAAETGADLADLIDPDGGYRWTDFTSFLEAYDRVARLYAAPECAGRLCDAALRACAAEGVIYAELIVSPDFAGAEPGLWAAYLAALDEGADRAEAETGIIARFIATGVRHFGPDAVTRAARLAVGAPSPRVTGFGLAGDERAGHPADFAPAFAIAREAGLGLTAHAGEFAGPESVRGALDALGVRRIGHGVRAIEDPALVDRLAAQGVTLEVCPGSNVALGVYPDLAAHPIGRLAAAGCRVTVSTDDPPFFHTSMSREYAALAAAGWTDAALEGLARTALDAAFCDAETKARLAARLGI
jgi:adenosine deaminase